MTKEQRQKWALFWMSMALAYSILDAVFGTPAKSAEFSYDRAIHTMYVTGDLEQGDGQKLHAYFNTIQWDGVNHIIFSFNSYGGNLMAGADIADVILSFRLQGWATATSVGFGGVCASACITAFAAGEHRFIMGHSPGMADGRLIVHTAVNGDDENATLTLAWIRSLKLMDVPSRVLGKLMLDGSRKGTQLDDADLEAWGVRWLQCVRNKCAPEDGNPINFTAHTEE